MPDQPRSPSLPARRHLVRTLERTADLLDVLGAETFRSQAYRSAARSLEQQREETPALLERQFAGIPKIGKGIAAELIHYAQTGEFVPLTEAEAQLPPSLLELLGVRGLGPKKLRTLWQAGFDSPDRVLAGVQSGELARVKGFGAKSAATLAAATEFLIEARQRQQLHAASAAAEQLLGWLADLHPAVSGELRRGMETVSEVVLTVTGTGAEVEARLSGHLSEQSVEGETLRGVLDGVPVRVVAALAEARGALDLLLSGSPEYCQGVLKQAEERGLRLEEGGLYEGQERLPTPTEAEALRLLDLPQRPAIYREPEHDGSWTLLPRPEALVQVSDIRGMLHTHSVWSDGTATIREMAEEVQRLGFGFLGTGDHSRAAHYAGGLSIERLREQVAEVRALQRAGLPIVAGAEVDILEDGSLDYPDDVLAELDYVVASVHTHLTLDPAQQTERLIRAVSHPLVTILGHPTGRVLLRRPGYDLDLDAVLSACAERGTVVEINATPYRLDLDWRDVLRWRERLTWAIDTDAHATAGLPQVRYGVLMAQKAGLTAEQVVNTLDQAAFLAFVKQQREARQGRPKI